MDWTATRHSPASRLPVGNGRVICKHPLRIARPLSRKRVARVALDSILGGRRLAALIACVPACSKKSGRITIGVVTNCTADFWTICEAGANKAAKENDVDLQFRQPEKAFDAAVQMQIVEAWAKQGLNGIAVSVIDPDGQTEDLTRIAKKLPLITMDNDADKTGRLCYIGIDNYEARQGRGPAGEEGSARTAALSPSSSAAPSRPTARPARRAFSTNSPAQKDAKGERGHASDQADLEGKMFGKYFFDGRRGEGGRRAGQGRRRRGRRARPRQGSRSLHGRPVRL